MYIKGWNNTWIETTWYVEKWEQQQNWKNSGKYGEKNEEI